MSPTGNGQPGVACNRDTRQRLRQPKDNGTGRTRSPGAFRTSTATRCSEENARPGGDGNRLDAEIRYGLPIIGAPFGGTPRVGLRTSEFGRDDRLGYAMQVIEQNKPNLQLGINAERRESPTFYLPSCRNRPAERRSPHSARAQRKSPNGR